MRAAIVLASGFAFRLALIARFPLIFGGDPLGRMLHRNRILVGHHLPLLQIIVAAVSQFTLNYIAVMCAMAAIGALVGLAFYLLARDFFDEQTAFLGALMMTTQPMVAAHSIVPYQEALMLACVLFAFHYFYSENYAASSIWLALGCITRYEAWIAAPVLTAAYFWKTRNPWKDAAIFGWAPVAWIIFRRGLAPEGSYVIESALEPARAMRWVYLGYITAKFTPAAVLVLAILGLAMLFRDRSKWSPRLWPMMLFVVLFTIAILFSAHGVLPDPVRRIASREAHLWMASAVFLATLALASFPRHRAALAAIAIAFGVWGTWQYVAREDSDPRMQLAYRLAKFFDRQLAPGEKALILAPPWDQRLFDFYLERARETGGEARYAAAVRNLAETADMSPPDYQRMLVHSGFDRTRLTADTGICTDWIALWNDYPNPPRDVAAPEVVLRADPLSVSISRRACR